MSCFQFDVAFVICIVLRAKVNRTWNQSYKKQNYAQVIAEMLSRMAFGSSGVLDKKIFTEKRSK